MKSLKEEVEGLKVSYPEDLDPEDDPFAKRNDESDSDEAPSETGITGREHYEEVEKSKLRKPEQPVLGKQYTGTAVSRKKLFDDDGNAQEGPSEEEDDPFMKPDTKSNDSQDLEENSAASGSGEDNEEAFGYEDPTREIGAENLDNQDSEIDSDEAFGEGDEETFKSKGFVFRGSKKELALRAENSGSAEEGNSDEDGALLWDTEDEVEIGSDQDAEMEDFESDLGSDSGENSVVSENDSSSSESDEFNEPTAKRSKHKSLLAHENHAESDLSSSESDSESSEKHNSHSNLSQRSHLKNLISNENGLVASSLLASASNDATKGRAIRTQYQTSDRFLDVRIKLQKGVTASNNISLNPDLITELELSSAARSAESAALKLFETIEAVRLSIANISSSEQNGAKRKRPLNTSENKSQDLWERLSALEKSAVPSRRVILNRWAAKNRAEKIHSQGLNIVRPRLGGVTNTAVDDSLTAMLDQQVSSSLPSTPATDQNQTSYDDNVFYQSLLRDLISSRATLSQQSQTSLSSNLETITSLPANGTLVSAPTQKKQHRANVDTKASKGRKVRYTVHEKLQNFTAEEVRETWSESARNEFFASLFGGSAVKLLDEDRGMEVDAESEYMDIDLGREEGALRLFRS